MKTPLLILTLALALIATSCGPSTKDDDKNQVTQDSLDSLDSNNSVDEANKLFDSIARADSLDSIARLNEGKADVAKK